MQRGKGHATEGVQPEKPCRSELLRGVWGERLVEENSRDQVQQEPCCAP